MASIRVEHTIGNLARDLRTIAVKAKPAMSKIVRRNTFEGNKIAQGIAQQASGVHGKNYWKRYTAEMVSPLVGEYGHDVGNAPVGGGWRSGPPNTDLPKSADIIGPKFGNDVQDAPGKWFWP